MDEEDSDTAIYSCPECLRHNIRELSHIIPQELYPQKFCHESSCGLMRGSELVRTSVLDFSKRFILLWQTRRAEIPNLDLLLQAKNLALIDMLKNKYTEFVYSGIEFERNETKPAIYGIINYHTKLKLISNKLFVLVFPVSSVNSKLSGVFLRSVLMNAKNGTFHFSDPIVLHETPVKDRGNIEFYLEHSEEILLQVHFSVGDGQSMTRESHHFKICNNQLIFLEKKSVPVPYCNFKPPFPRVPDVLDKKRYEFKRIWKFNERFGRQIINTDYTRVRIYDLEQPSKMPKLLRTQYEHDELKAVPECYEVREWHRSGLMFVPIVSQSMQHYHIYCFNAPLLKWNRVKWIQFPINHSHFGFLDHPIICMTTNILNVISPNTLVLQSQFRTRDGNQQVISHRNYYRITVGFPEHLYNLAWSKVQTSVYKRLPHSILFSKFN